MSYSIYNINTGRINRIYDGSDNLLLDNVYDGEDYIINDGVVFDTEYYVAGSPRSITERPDMNTSVDKSEVVEDTESLTLTAPEGAFVEIVGPANDDFIMETSSEEIIFNYPGNYNIQVTLFPYREKVIEVKVNEGS